MTGGQGRYLPGARQRAPAPRGPRSAALIRLGPEPAAGAAPTSRLAQTK